MTLQLEYSCTEAEMKEAQTLHLRRQCGRGSKWLTRLWLFGLLAITVAGLCFRFKREIPPQDRPWLIALIIMVYIALLIFKRMTHRKANELVRLEVSEREVVFNGGDGRGRTAMQWPAFSQCIESPNLFVLVDRPKAILFVVPKRAFPDEAAQNWFRAQADQPQSVAPAVVDEAFVPGRFVSANGIALTLQLKYRDYLERYITSWRIKGMFIGIFALVTGITFFSTPPPDAVNSPLKTFLIMLPMLMGMMVFIIFAVSVVSWRGEKKYLAPRQIVLTSDGIEFAGRDSNGRLPWSTYKYYQESRWSFFVWHPRGSIWLMFPKREFASPSDLVQFRALLQANLKPSRWFYL